MAVFDLEFKPSKFGALSVVVYYYMEKETLLKCERSLLMWSEFVKSTDDTKSSLMYKSV